jgi:hypothetical protein
VVVNRQEMSIGMRTGSNAPEMAEIASAVWHSSVCMATSYAAIRRKRERSICTKRYSASFSALRTRRKYLLNDKSPVDESLIAGKQCVGKRF